MVDWTNGYTITSNGIDIGRDGNAVPWSRTRWSSGIDFKESTRNLVQTTTVGGRTFEVYAEPDSLGRGPKGLNYDVEPADGGETPAAFTSVMTSEAQIKERFAEYVESLKEEKRGKKETKQKVQTLENGWVVWTYLDDDGRRLWYVKDGDGKYIGKDGKRWDKQRAFEAKSGVRGAIKEAARELRQSKRGREKTKEKVQTLENGWSIWSYIDKSGERRWYVKPDAGYLNPDGTTSSSFRALSSQSEVREAIKNATSPDTISSLGYGWVLSQTPDGQFFVLGRKEDGVTYLEEDGSMSSTKKTYASKKRARRAFRRWRSETVGERRAEANKRRMEQSEEFQERIDQPRRRSQTSPRVEVTREETDSKKKESESTRQQDKNSSVVSITRGSK